MTEIKLIKRVHAPYMTVFPVSVLAAAFGFYLFERTRHKFLGVGLISFAAILPMFVWATFEDELGLVLNDDGIFDRRLGLGLIPWSDVREAHLVSKYGNDYICLRLANPEKYVQLLPEIKRKSALRNHELGLKTFNIGITRLNMNKYDILDLVQKQIQKTKAGTA